MRKLSGCPSSDELDAYLKEVGAQHGDEGFTGQLLPAGIFVPRTHHEGLVLAEFERSLER